MKQSSIFTEFATDILKGLSATPKFLMSKYFYDEQGSHIFQDIMQMPEYYLTDCELEIFKTRKQDILEAFICQEDTFELIELGAGDGLKTKILLAHFQHKKIAFNYVAIDISNTAVERLITSLKKEIPGLKVTGQTGDYFALINDLNNDRRRKKIILFLGSNIGNLDERKSLNFLQHIRASLNPHDLLFIGFDLKKDPAIILKAYNDPHGHTAAFNLNLLQRINDELKANFILDNFKHRELYDSQSGIAKSELVSLKKQKVTVRNINKTFTFERDETIFMEMSRKYDIDTINDLAEKSGFQVVRNFFDQRLYYADSLWKLKLHDK